MVVTSRMTICVASAFESSWKCSTRSSRTS